MTEPINPLTRAVSFLMGKLHVDEYAHEAAAKAGTSVVALLQRHSGGDFGNAAAPDLQERNRRAVLDGFEIKSLYRLADGTVIAIRTNSNRSETRVAVLDEDDLESLL